MLTSRIKKLHNVKTRTTVISQVTTEFHYTINRLRHLLFLRQHLSKNVWLTNTFIIFGSRWKVNPKIEESAVLRKHTGPYFSWKLRISERFTIVGVCFFLYMNLTVCLSFYQYPRRCQYLLFIFKKIVGTNK